MVKVQGLATPADPVPQDVRLVETEDWVLQAVIEEVAVSRIEMGVILTIGGSVVSGTLISGNTYFKELLALVAAATGTDSPVMRHMRRTWADYRSVFDRPDGAPHDWRPPAADYLHLRDARFFAPGREQTLPSKEGMLWRGRVASVDGFAFGLLSPEG